MKKFLILFLIGIFIPFPVAAQSTTREVREISISPFLEELEVEKGGQIESVIELTNTTEQELLIYISTRDFLPGGRGQPLFVPDDEYNEITFSLAAWITIEDGSQVLMAPGETRAIRYSVNPPENAEQGTHYGAILFSLTDGTTLSGVGITQSVGTIIIVGYGEARSEGELLFSADRKFSWWNDKIEFTSTFLNTGRVHVKPRGEVYIKNMFGRVVATPFVNRDASTVLPESDRTFISDWFPSRIAFGPYRAEAVLYYGKERLEARAEVVVWILPIYILVILTAILIAIAWFFFHGRHWHRRRIIDKHIQPKAP
ncbi:MAG TPA: hypothetical protein PKD79_01725 [Candidatus Doudnabacteria bacterium]|nr:hypothetical protein [Candidatus Doudnabacteria bacterium]